MMKNILVPLDGSRLGESALPLAASIAERFSASVTFIHVIEKNAPEAVHGERHLAAVAEAEEYLKEVSDRPIFAGITTKMHVHTAEVDDVARSIVEHSLEFAPDLVVITTHGKRTARQLVIGTVAQQVIKLGKTPVLVVRPKEDAAEEQERGAQTCPLVLVPIDAEPAHEKALFHAMQFAHAFNSRIHLLTAVPNVGDLRGSDSAAALLSPSAMRARLELDFQGADEYLRERAEEIAKEGIAVTTQSVRGDAANAIVDLADRAKAGMIILGTHGKSGSQAFWHESVAARVVTRTDVPVLLVQVNR